MIETKADRLFFRCVKVTEMLSFVGGLAFIIFIIARYL